MNLEKTSRRQFVQLAAGAALTLRHGLLPAKPGAATGDAVAGLEDGALRIEWDSTLRTRLTRLGARGETPLTHWGASDYLLRADGRHLAHFHHRRHSSVDTVDDVHGPGRRITLVGSSPDDVEKTVQVTLYDRHPGFAVVRVSYVNRSAIALPLTGWTCNDALLIGSPTRTERRPPTAPSPATPSPSHAASGPVGTTPSPGFWSYSGASYEDRRDWVQPVGRGFAQDNFLGMEASDYGGGTPIVDVWRRDGGLAVGHVEILPQLVSLPVQEHEGRVRLAVCCRTKRVMEPGDHLDTLDTFLSTHAGDHFATLNTYRQLVAERGLIPAVPHPGCYEPLWCAWGYERDCTTALIEGTLPKVKDLGLQWAVIDDGWQAKIGDWTPHPAKYPHGEADLRGLVASIRAHDLKPRLWYSPLSVAPGADLLHDHADMLLLDRDGAVQKISWWNSFYLCPAYRPTVDHTRALVKRFIGDWGFAGLKVDGQHLNGVAPCFNPAHHHARPEESVEALHDVFRVMYEAALEADPQAVMELCPCGTAYSVYNFPYMNQAPASDPENSWQVRLKGKSLKALMGSRAPFAGDHVELSDDAHDFASTVGIGGVVSTKFTWPIDPKPKDSFLLTPVKEAQWRRWIALYHDKMLPLGDYRGELYDIGFDEPETHVIEKEGRLYYAMFAERFRGEVTLRGLPAGQCSIRDYFNDRDLGTVDGGAHRLPISFEGFLLLEARTA